MEQKVYYLQLKKKTRNRCKKEYSVISDYIHTMHFFKELNRTTKNCKLQSRKNELKLIIKYVRNLRSIVQYVKVLFYYFNLPKSILLKEGIKRSHTPDQMLLQGR